MKVDFEKFTGALPYASELYGVYQPLLGWKSRLIMRRIAAGIDSFRRSFLIQYVPRFSPRIEFSRQTLHPREVQFHVGLAGESQRTSPLIAYATGSIIAKKALAAIEQDGVDHPEAWSKYTSADSLAEMLKASTDDIRNEYAKRLEAVLQQRQGELSNNQQAQVLTEILNRESIAAGALAFLHDNGDAYQMMALMGPGSAVINLAQRVRYTAGFLKLIDPRESALASAVISPIGIVHLFRQYFFEFSTFLGPAVEHLWLSPGGTVELVEVTTRRTIVERTVETGTESTDIADKSLVLDDELSDMVRQENSSNTKFGVSVNTQASFSAAAIFTAQVNAGTSFDLASNESYAREQVHRGTRQQAEHISTELKRNIKTTFKITTETTDTKSRKYTIQNTTPNLINYELRRKMRQVGIQVQDYGTSLCWQTYVDKPGDELGVANLVHIAVPNDMPPRQHPALLAVPSPYPGEKIKFSYRWPLTDETHVLGIGQGLDPEYFGDVIAGRFPLFPNPGFKFDHADITIVSDPKWAWATRPINPQSIAPGIGETGATELELFMPPTIYDSDVGDLRQVLTDEHPTFVFEITPVFVPSDYLIGTIRTANEQKEKEANQEQERAYKEKLFNAVKERVRIASNIQARRFEDLREEERIVVYRNLIRQLMQDTGVATAEPQVQHVFAELIQSMFDVDKMLYFVAPEWWTPHATTAEQGVFRPEIDQAEFKKWSTVTWGGARSDRPDNYYITEDSGPAKLGSSLGWVIQLDGDNLRNAFLNAPWVKAVIPIREGKEHDAMDWLAGAGIEGDGGLGAAYVPGAPDELTRIREALGLPPAQQVTIRDAINYLIRRVQEKQATSRQKEHDAGDPKLDYLPADKVYEHGFDPLPDGFKMAADKPFEVFDQWVEVVPTDQIVPVAVDYDPKTGLQR